MSVKLKAESDAALAQLLISYAASIAAGLAAVRKMNLPTESRVGAYGL